MSAAQTPEEIATAWVVAMSAAVTAMQPADRKRGMAALDAHAAARLVRGELTAEGAAAAMDRLRALLVELLPQAEAARFASGSTGAAPESPPARGPRRIEIEFPNGSAALTLSHVAQILVAVVVNVASLCPALGLRVSHGWAADGRLMLDVLADGEADSAPADASDGDAASLPGGAPDILSQAGEIARAAWEDWAAPGARTGGAA